MSELSLHPKTVLPPEMTVIVCETRHGYQHFPLVKIEQRQDGHTAITSGISNAPLGVAILQEALHLCIAETTLRAIQAQISPAERSEPAAPPDQDRDVADQA